MATIRISRYEVRNNLLPSVCMVTGEPTGDTKRHTFRWTPPWVGVLILAGLLPYIIAALILRKDITIEVPLVAHKRGHWFVRQAFGLIGVCGCILVGLGGIALSADFNNKLNQGPDIGLMLTAAAGVGLLVVIVASLILQNSTVRPREITDDDITLTGVHENFLRAMDEERDREEEEEEERRERDRPRRDRGPRERQEY